ncbi:hypothetical protein PVAP13_4KG061790 [Panicum virgatum]|uniref:Uncharacterized protein n=1 Tax=Panicum virgatum TaxID=38727 RepID=A0A8T0TC04_PANVG|nr:hypothetical protein PVAP13_4KG061790 [Panicum virgatum]
MVTWTTCSNPIHEAGVPDHQPSHLGGHEGGGAPPSHLGGHEGGCSCKSSTSPARPPTQFGGSRSSTPSALAAPADHRRAQPQGVPRQHGRRARQGRRCIRHPVPVQRSGNSSVSGPARRSPLAWWRSCTCSWRLTTRVGGTHTSRAAAA